MGAKKKACSSRHTAGRRHQSISTPFALEVWEMTTIEAGHSSSREMPRSQDNGPWVPGFQAEKKPYTHCLSVVEVLVKEAGPRRLSWVTSAEKATSDRRGEEKRATGVKVDNPPCPAGQGFLTFGELSPKTAYLGVFLGSWLDGPDIISLDPRGFNRSRVLPCLARTHTWHVHCGPCQSPFENNTRTGRGVLSHLEVSACQL